MLSYVGMNLFVVVRWCEPQAEEDLRIDVHNCELHLQSALRAMDDLYPSIMVCVQGRQVGEDLLVAAHECVLRMRSITPVESGNLELHVQSTFT